MILARRVPKMDGISIVRQLRQTRIGAPILLLTAGDRLRVRQTGDQLQRPSQTLNEMLSRLESSVRRMAQFTADASHELRAPVSLMRTTAEVAVLKRDEEAERTSQVVDSLTPGSRLEPRS